MVITKPWIFCCKPRKLFWIKIVKIVLEDIKNRIDQLQLEVKNLKERKIQQDTDIANIENINLRQRFIDISNNLLTELLKKQQQVCY